VCEIVGVVDFETHPSRYRHWRLDVAGERATLTLDVDERGGLQPGYELKLNSYDLGVDIELYDATQRLRFEYPQVRAVVLASGKDRVFCAGANIRMLALASHQWKVNFCKFTNETRNGVEESSATWIAALNGTTAGGGYEIALACDEIVLVDDGSSAVSLPEVPLLGVLPGTGGLTRLLDKRQVRRDLADVFATRAEGVRGQTAVDWGLVDAIAPPRRFAELIDERVAAALAAPADPARAAATGIELPPLDRTTGDTGDTRPGATAAPGPAAAGPHPAATGNTGRDDGTGPDASAPGAPGAGPDWMAYQHVRCRLDRPGGVAEITIAGPDGVPADAAELHQQGAAGWALATARELDDLILRLRVDEPELGTWLLRTTGDPGTLVSYDGFLASHRDDWLVGETVAFLGRVLARLDQSARSLFALIEPGSCFAGPLAELAFAADRSFMLDGPREDGDETATITLTEANFGGYPMASGRGRLDVRFAGRTEPVDATRKLIGRPLEAAEAYEAGLVTFAPDDLDWDEEVRLAVEERAAFSPDALTGLEANLRFGGPETLQTKIFGRLTAWQNWIFQRPNAAGPDGALRRYGTGQRPAFDRKRV
jgi:benzoyl-CoA-dihydrodiol lyase